MQYSIKRYNIVGEDSNAHKGRNQWDRKRKKNGKNQSPEIISFLKGLKINNLSKTSSEWKLIPWILGMKGDITSHREK